MTTSIPPSVGIDLGTTYSVIARLGERGELIALRNAEGDYLTPSVVHFDGEDVVVGKEALKAMVIEAEQVAECSKRDVGHRVFHKAFGGRQYPPEVIEAWILNKLRVDAAAQIGPFSKVVITVPAYFDEVRRKATQDAGYMAGFEVMDIINEPTAAAVAFGYQKDLLGVEADEDSLRRIFVYDLGGGTFDVTVMELRGIDFKTLATDGAVGLGGYDWDKRLIDLVAESFIREHGVDPREDPNTAGKLWRECEDAKRTLAAKKKASVVCNYRGFTSRVEVTKGQFEEVTQDLLDVTRDRAVDALKTAGLNWSDIDHVLLVGGSTRMPMVRDMLRQLTGQEPDASVAADEAVAHGATLYANRLLAIYEGRPPKFGITNVNSHSLGVVGTDSQTLRKRNEILIKQNTQLPATGKRTFSTIRKDQPSILVRIVEGESRSPDECGEIGKCVVHDLPAGLPKGWPVDVSLDCQPDGRLKVHVTVPNTNRQVEAEFVRYNSLSKEHLDGWRKYICGMDPSDYR